MYKPYNPNPKLRSTGDCTVRATARATGTTWEKALIGMCVESLVCCDMPSSNWVVGEYLKKNGFKKKFLAEPATVAEFTECNKKGLFVLCSGTHVVCVENGDYYDSWDSGNEMIIYYWEKE